MNDISYRKFTGENDSELIDLFKKTFSDSENEEEGKQIAELVEKLITTTKKEDLHIYICKKDKKIIASAIFSRIKFDSSKIVAFIMSPVAVHTDFQKSGIGQRLLNYAHEDLKQKAIDLVLTYGDINFYSKTGYIQISEDVIKSPQKLSYPEGWLAMSLTGDEIKPISGNTFCVDALRDPRYW